MSDRVVAFVNAVGDHRADDGATETVVLSPWWTPGPDADPTLRPVRPIAQDVLRDVDLHGTSIAALDRWAMEAAVASALSHDGIGWWDRIRMAIRWDVYELVLWRHVLGRLDATARFDRAVVPSDRPNLAAACRALGLAVTLRDAPAAHRQEGKVGTGAAAGRGPTSASTSVDLGRGRDAAVRAGRRAARLCRRVAVRLGVAAPPADDSRIRRAVLDERFATLAAGQPILAITWAGAYQVVEAGGRPRLGDPFLDPAIDRLAAEGNAVAVAVMGRNHRNPDDWAHIEADGTVLPFSYIASRWGKSDVVVDSEAEWRAAWQRPAPPFDIDGCDFGEVARELVAGYAGAWLDERRRWFTVAHRFLQDLRPRALLIDREGTRMPWIAAAQRLGIRVVTMQHGMIYHDNPEYVRPPVPGAVRPDRTCVFGPYERDLLLRDARYAPEEVVVTGSPRVGSLDPAPLPPAVRADIRRQLGVGEGAFAVVVSAAHNPVGELWTACMIATALDGPLPGVHLIVKVHPQDQQPGDFAGLVAGLAAAGGYEAPALSVVRDIDLGRLLGAADAHVGQSSTVLTDAVAAGLPNLLVLGAAHADPLGYAAAGVAVGVRNADDVRAFVANPSAPSPEASRAFLAAHFLPGDATRRLVDVVTAAAAAATGRAADAIEQRAG